MSDDGTAWASRLALSDQLAERFTTISEALSLSAGKLVGRMVAFVVTTHDEMRGVGPSDMLSGVSSGERGAMVVQHAMSALPTDIRPIEFMWPANKPFPWAAEECKAAVIGYEVRWCGTKDNFLNHLRGHWEMSSNGYAVRQQS